MSYSDIIDNRRSFLKDEINSVPEATEKDKFAVGYLFLSGFNEVVIYKESIQNSRHCLENYPGATMLNFWVSLMIWPGLFMKNNVTAPFRC